MKTSVGLAIAALLGVAISAEYEFLLRATALPDVMPPTLVLWAIAGTLTATAAWLIAFQQTNALKLARHLSLCVAWLAIAVVPVSAQSPDVRRQAGDMPEVRVSHQRPVLIQADRQFALHEGARQTNKETFRL